MPIATPRPMDFQRTRSSRTSPRNIVVVVALVVVTLASLVWRASDPALSVDASTVLIDTVRTLPFGREVRVPGNLAAERVDWVTAQASARIERIVVRAGDSVSSGAVLLHLTNPDVQIQTLQAEQQARQAERDVLQTTLDLAQVRISQESVIATLRTQWSNAQQELLTASELLRRGLASEMDERGKHAFFDELDFRLRGEQARLKLMMDSEPAQLDYLRENAKRLRAIALFQSERLAAMTVRAPTAGVVQELDLQPGQWIPEGRTLAKIVLPGRLKALLRVPETQAGEVQVGQEVTIDTRNGLVRGVVSAKAPGAQSGTITVEASLRDGLPAGAVSDLSVEGTIELEIPRQAVSVSRPDGARSGSGWVFLLNAHGTEAVRTAVTFGRITATRAEVVAGIREGDRIVVSSVSAWGDSPHIRLVSP